MDVFPYLLVAASAYLVGSIPTGAIVARLYRNVDLTSVGSARTGATNTTRALGLGAGLVVLVGDFAKGFGAVWLAPQLAESPAAPGLALFFAVVGHNRSLFLLGRGGRGVLTGLGGLAASSPGVFIIGCLTGCIVAALTRYISLGSISGAIATVIAASIAYSMGMIGGDFTLFAVVTALLVIAAHWDNIARLRAGTERRLGRQAVDNKQ